MPVNYHLKEYKQMNTAIQELLTAINQLSKDIESTNDNWHKKVLKAYAELKIRMLTGLLKVL